MNPHYDSNGIIYLKMESCNIYISIFDKFCVKYFRQSPLIVHVKTENFFSDFDLGNRL